MRVLFVILLLSLAASAPAQQRFRVLFGGTDKATADWSGQVSAENGSATIVGMYHFSPEESFDAASWKAGNQWDGNVNLLPQEWAVFSPARWKGVFIDVEGGDQAVVRLRTQQGEAEFRSGALNYHDTLKLLDGRIEVERTPRAERASDALSDEDYPAMTTGPDGRIWAAWVRSQDGQETIEIRSSDDGESWRDAEQVTPQAGDYFQPTLISTAADSVLVVWPAADGRAVDLFAREYLNGAWGGVERLTRTLGPDTFPHMAAAPNGDVYLVWQSPGGRNSDISLRIRKNGVWGAAWSVTSHPASDWEPSVAVNSRGEAAIAWDSYRHGNYDIFLRRMTNGRLGPLERITSGEDFEAHVSLVYDQRDRLWMAFDNGGPNWGKDRHGINGILRGESGLYAKREIQIRVLERGRIMQPARPFDDNFPSGVILGSRMTLGLQSSYRRFTELPALQLDARGRVWAVVRSRTIGRFNPPSLESRSILPYWKYHATMFDGSAWTKPIEIPFSGGRIEQRPGVTVDRTGDLWIASQTDGRGLARSDERFNQYDLWIGKIAIERTRSGAVDEELLIASSDLAAPQAVPDDAPALETPIWKTYRMDVGGQKYVVTWGDLHRHTDLSFDGHSDGSLYDVYRYAIDAAQMDFLGPSEHLLPDNDVTDYVWRMVDKTVDFYQIPGSFYPLLNYERTVAYPDGHRNIVSRGRGYQPFRIQPGDTPLGSAEDDMIQLWRKLLDGREVPEAISIPHTTATQMGTDWRYNDERVERLVEIFQGNRDSYEYFGAPRGAVAQQILVGGYITSGEMREKGFVWNALAKGYKMGFIASSDHRSTHMSYAAVYTPVRSYDSIWDSLYARRTYAATDNIVVDFQCQGRAMGESFSSDQLPRLEVAVIGTGKIKQLDIIKDNAFVYTAHPGVEELSFTYTDRQVTPGEHYYYVRVIQEDENMAWASPIWIDYQAPAR